MILAYFCPKPTSSKTLFIMPPHTSPKAEPTTNMSWHNNEIGGNARALFGNVTNKYKNIKRVTSGSERVEKLRWLSDLAFKSRHDEIRQNAGILKRHRVPENGNFYGKWLLTSTQFCQWREGALQKLWYVGMPGAGKSVLASIIVDNLTQVQSDVQFDHAPKVAYLYFEYSNRESYTPKHLLGGILCQIVERDKRLQKLVHRRRRMCLGAPTLGDLQDLLYEVVEASRGVYLVIDALDECPPELRCELFKLLPEHTGLRILVTSRYLNELGSATEGFTMMIIRADEQDLGIFIDERLSQFPLLRNLEAKTAREIIQLVKLQVINRCGGM